MTPFTSTGDEFTSTGTIYLNGKQIDLNGTGSVAGTFNAVPDTLISVAA